MRSPLSAPFDIRDITRIPALTMQNKHTYVITDREMGGDREQLHLKLLNIRR